MKYFVAVLTAGLLCPAFAYSQQPAGTPDSADAFVANARKYLGAEYLYEGRMTKHLPGLDCLGLVFIAYEKTTGCSWKNLDVITSRLIRKNQLGRPAPGLDGVQKDSLDYSLLKPGDVVHFLKPYKVSSDQALAVINGIKYYAYHLGIYEGDSLVIHANPGDSVREHKLYQIPGDAVVVTRPFLRDTVNK